VPFGRVWWQAGICRIELKDTYREKDKLDRAFLTRLIDQRKKC